MSVRSQVLGTSDESTNTHPPGTTLRSNLSSDGRFITMRMSGAVTSGLPIGLSSMLTEQLQVPPRISGP